MVNVWTRDDLPGIHSPGIHGHEGRQGADAALEEVVKHLNRHHPKPCVNRVLVAGQSPAWVFRALEDDHQKALSKVERERDEAVARAEKSATVIDGLKLELVSRASRAESAERERDEALEASALFQRDVHEWRTRAEAAEARTARTVTREDVEKAIRGKVWAANRGPNKAGFHRVHVDWATDAVWSLVSGADQVEAKARELWEVARFKDSDEWSSLLQVERDCYRRMAAHVLGQGDRHVDQ